MIIVGSILTLTPTIFHLRRHWQAAGRWSLPAHERNRWSSGEKPAYCILNPNPDSSEAQTMVPE
jgi:hypothetical protein